MMKKIVWCVGALLINVHSLYAADWVNCMYAEVVSLYKTGVEVGDSTTVNHFVVATARDPGAVVASYDVIMNHEAKTVAVKRIGSPHAKEAWYVSIIKQWFDNNDGEVMQWRGLEAAAE